VKHQIAVWALRTLTIVVVIGAWLWGNGPGGVPNFLLPRFFGVFESLGLLATSAPLWDALGRTLIEILAAGTIAVTAGLAFGFLAARSAFMSKLVEPVLAWGYMMPLVLFYPLFILWFGLDMPSKIAFAAFAAFIPIAFNSLRGFSTVDPRFVRMAHAFGASRGQIDFSVKFRAAMPVVAAGLRIGAATTFAIVIVAEMLASTGGLGYLIAQSAHTFSASNAYALVLVVLTLVAIMQVLMTRFLPIEYAKHRRHRPREE
jgi:ABC-type nitrate/sulfonate/bicarbonate transport system permease component